MTARCTGSRNRSPPEDRPRIHLDLYADTTAEQRIEAARLVRLGARAVERDSRPADPGFGVLPDPDGHLFRVVDLSPRTRWRWPPSGLITPGGRGAPGLPGPGGRRPGPCPGGAVARAGPLLPGCSGFFRQGCERRPPAERDPESPFPMTRFSAFGRVDTGLQVRPCSESGGTPVGVASRSGVHARPRRRCGRHVDTAGARRPARRFALTIPTAKGNESDRHLARADHH